VPNSPGDDQFSRTLTHPPRLGLLPSESAPAGCKTPPVLWVSAAVCVLVGTVVHGFFLRYARRNGHEGYWVSKGANIPAIPIGAGIGVLLVKPGNGLLLLALAVPAVVVTLFWYRQLR
jgi:hypothetical protein